MSAPEAEDAPGGTVWTVRDSGSSCSARSGTALSDRSFTFTSEHAKIQLLVHTNRCRCFVANSSGSKQWHQFMTITITQFRSKQDTSQQTYSFTFLLCESTWERTESPKLTWWLHNSQSRHAVGVQRSRITASRRSPPKNANTTTWWDGWDKIQCWTGIAIAIAQHKPSVHQAGFTCGLGTSYARLTSPRGRFDGSGVRRTLRWTESERFVGWMLASVSLRWFRCFGPAACCAIYPGGVQTFRHVQELGISGACRELQIETESCSLSGNWIGFVWFGAACGIRSTSAPVTAPPGSEEHRVWKSGSIICARGSSRAWVAGLSRDAQTFSWLHAHKLSRQYFPTVMDKMHILLKKDITKFHKATCRQPPGFYLLFPCQVATHCQPLSVKSVCCLRALDEYFTK